MTVVIDVGAARYGGDYSMERLIVQFEPTHLYAIDPNPELVLPSAQTTADLFAAESCRSEWGETQIRLYRKAAWTHDGEIGFRADGLNSWVSERGDAPMVPCLDLAGFIDDLWLEHEQKLVLKLDCEGSEYDLLPHLIEKHADSMLDLVIVEWHPRTRNDSDLIRSLVEQDIRCELQEWPY